MSTRMRLMQRLLVLPVVLVALLFAGQPAASARDIECRENTSYKSVHKTYYRSGDAYVLRCGTGSWGRRHLNARWSTSFSALIAETISRGQKSTGTGGLTYFHKHRYVAGIQREEIFRVVFNGNAYGADATLRPQGVITAYNPSEPTR